jgi:hypothetical protein
MNKKLVKPFIIFDHEYRKWTGTHIQTYERNMPQFYNQSKNNAIGLKFYAKNIPAC